MTNKNETEIAIVYDGDGNRLSKTGSGDDQVPGGFEHPRPYAQVVGQTRYDTLA